MIYYAHKIGSGIRPAEKGLLYMKFGFFDDNKKEYVIETPETPLPWINYLGSKEFFSLISNTGGGYSFFKDAGFRRITRYRYNGVPSDGGGRMYYIRDGDVDWSPAFRPLETPLDTYQCRHGMGYTVFESSKNSLHATLTCFVPKEEPCEVNRLVLKNESDTVKRIDVVSAVEWCLWNADDDGRNFQRNFNTGEVEIEQGTGSGTLYHKTEYRERRNHYAFFSVNKELAGFDTSREAFLGKFAGWHNPQTVIAGKSGDSVAHGWAPMASHRVSLTIQPGETVSLIYVLGYADLEQYFGYPQNAELPTEIKWESPGVINKTPARELIGKFQNDEQVDGALAELAAHWEALLGKFQVKSGDDRLDRMVNIWNQYQCMVTFNLSRSASYYEGGVGRGMGFRDSCQDVLGFVHMLPGDQRVRARILDIASIQQSDYINCYHQYMPLIKKGNATVGGGFNDDPLWLIGSASAYIKESGDASILSEIVPFEDKPDEKATLFDHLKASIHFIRGKIGQHGLPKIGRADWNDCLNLNIMSTDPNESYQTGTLRGADEAVSVFIAGMFVLYGKQYVELCERFASRADFDAVADAALIADEVKKMEQAVLDKGWDGEWFVRAFDNDGQAIGSKECAEGKIFVEPQGMCVMAGIGVETGEARKALDSTKKHLTYEYGSCLLWPCYSVYDKKLGEISSYPPGYKENGSIFCHNNPWVSIAEAVMGNAEEAFQVYRRICPAYLEEQSEVHRTEPYVYCQTISGQEAAGMKGEGKNSWLTGTAAWTFVNVSQYLLGIQPDYEGLKLAPCLPEQFNDITVTRMFRGCEYRIKIERSGRAGLTVDGQDIAGDVIAHVDGRTVCDVRFGM